MISQEQIYKALLSDNIFNTLGDYYSDYTSQYDNEDTIKSLLMDDVAFLIHKGVLPIISPRVAVEDFFNRL